MSIPLNGSSNPDDDPETSEAEFLVEFLPFSTALARFCHQSPPASEGDISDAIATEEQTSLILAFIRRHRRRMDRMGLDPQRILDFIGCLHASLAEQISRYTRATDNVLHAQADLAEKGAAYILSLLKIEADIRADWPLMPEALRTEARPLLALCEENRAAWLAMLPIDDRRFVEENYPL